jgi:hypothetical protein
VNLEIKYVITALLHYQLEKTDKVTKLHSSLASFKDRPPRPPIFAFGIWRSSLAHADLPEVRGYHPPTPSSSSTRHKLWQLMHTHFWGPRTLSTSANIVHIRSNHSNFPKIKPISINSDSNFS